jgi:glycosyltransferase involved in cell wall biosynthesis
VTAHLSIVVPVYSGEAHLADLCAEIAELRDSWSERFEGLTLEEAIFVDDAAIDGSPGILAELEQKYPWVHVVTLGKNFGQHPATMAGILHASGDWVATLDEDLQHRPAAIEPMLRRAVTEGHDVVYAQPEGEVHGSWRRDFLSRTYKMLLARLAGNPVIAGFNSFRICRGGVARAASSVAGHETYLDVALTWFTDRFGFEPVAMTDQRYQSSGRSGYSLRKLISHARRLLVSSHAKAIRTVAFIGAVAVAIAVVMAARAIYLRFTDVALEAVRGWTSTFVTLLFFGGMTVFILVVMSEYLLNIVLHTQGKPTFFAVDRSGDEALAAILTWPDASTETD